MKWLPVAVVALAAGMARAQPADPAPAPTPTPTPTTGLETRIAKLEAQLAELQAASDASLTEAATNDDAKEPAFRLYGYIDMGFQKLWAIDDAAIPTTKTTFVLGNVNLYFDFHPAQDWSSLIEVRLTNYPAGDDQVGFLGSGVSYSRSDVTVADPGNGAGYDLVKWGAIVLERAYIQWQRSSKLGIRVGQFLTPYGIWNVDHGTPTLISLFRPEAESHELFPEHQLGIEVFGRLDGVPAPDWQLDWHGYLSNGRTPGVVALTEDKMFGGRVVASTRRPVAMAFGASGMHGVYVDQQHLQDTSGLALRPETVHYNEWALGLDASVDLGALRLRTEMAMRHKQYRTDERDQWFPGVYAADALEVDTYGLAAYRIRNTRFEPYLYDEYYKYPTPAGSALLISSAGVNTYFTPAIQLKAQMSWVHVVDVSPLSPKSNPDEYFLAAKLVMGF